MQIVFLVQENQVKMEEVAQVHQRIAPFICNTPLERSVFASQRGNANVYYKCEHFQYTGSFKVRGALNKILSLSPEVRSSGVIAASTGNHGMATCYAALQVDHCPVTIYVPSGASQAKIEVIKELDGNLVVVESSNCVDVEIAARRASETTNQTFLSPYNDRDVMLGQGTIAYEICEQLKAKQSAPDAIFVSVGGGGLIGGIVSYIKQAYPSCQVIGCQPVNSNVMKQSVDAGKILFDVPEYDTLSDGTAGAIEEESITFDVCKNLVDRFVCVSEEEIEKGLMWALEKEHFVIEGAAAVTIAGYFQVCKDFENKNVVLVLCGRNITLSKLSAVQSKYNSK